MGYQVQTLDFVAACEKRAEMKSAEFQIEKEKVKNNKFKLAIQAAIEEKFLDFEGDLELEAC